MHRFLSIAAALLLLAMTAACAASLDVDAQPSTEGYNWIITEGHRVEMRSCAEWTCSVISNLEPGTSVMVLEYGNSWTRVRSRLSANEGWVPAERVVQRYY